MSVKALKQPAGTRSAIGNHGGKHEFGPFLLDCDQRLLLRGTDVLALTPKAFDLLCLLVTHSPSVISKDELMREVWADTFVGEDSLTQHVAMVRRALGDPSEHPTYIATVHKHGYRFIGSVRRVDANDVREPQPDHHRDTTRHPNPPGVAADALPQPAVPHRTLGWRHRVLFVLGAGGVLALAGVSLSYVRHLATHSPNQPVRFTIAPPQDTRLASVGFPSPDGQQIAFAAVDASGNTALWVRQLDSIDARRIDGTDGAAQPFWSADGRSLGFFADGRLKVVALAGGRPQVMTTLPGSIPAGGAWSKHGDILFGQRRSGLSLIPAAGGAKQAVTPLDPSLLETEHIWPHFLPDGIHFLYGVRSARPELNGVYVGAIGSNAKTRILSGTLAATFADGRLFFVRDGTLLSEPFDPVHLQMTGTTEPLAGGVADEGSPSAVTAAATGGGVIAYVNDGGPSHLTWFDRTGRPLGVVDTPAELSDVNLSPDERQLAATELSSPTAGVWLFDFRRQVGSRLTTIGSNPVWSRDGSHITFSSSQDSGVLSLYQRSMVGTEREQLIFKSGRSAWVNDASTDGRYILFAVLDATTKLDLWLLPTAGARRPIPFLATPFNEFQAQISPNGRWVAFTADETGTWEVYVRAFPTAGGKHTISTHRGFQPRWRADGRELFYVAPDRMLMAVPIRENTGALEVGIPQPLFRVQTRTGLVTHRRSYAVAANGQRFLVETENQRANQSVTVILNWRPPASSSRSMWIASLF
jgi:eukaryotic-like serine/threonine-protein kinase